MGTLSPATKTWTSPRLRVTLSLVGKIIKKKDIKPGSLTRLQRPGAESQTTADISDDNVIQAILKQP